MIVGSSSARFAGKDEPAISASISLMIFVWTEDDNLYFEHFSLYFELY